MNEVRHSFGITYDDSKKEVYVFGTGSTRSFQGSCEKYSIDKNEWTVLNPMTKNKSEMSACIFNYQYIFIIGGYISGKVEKHLNEIDKYSIDLNSWETIKITGYK